MGLGCAHLSPPLSSYLPLSQFSHSLFGSSPLHSPLEEMGLCESVWVSLCMCGVRERHMCVQGFKVKSQDQLVLKISLTLLDVV